MLKDEAMRFSPGLNGYDYFFQQNVNLSGKYRKQIDIHVIRSDGISHKMIKMSLKKLPLSFYRRNDVVEIAKDLIGKILVTRWDGIVTSGRIIETEAYAGVMDKASHAYGGRRTNRTEIMYADGGYAYVYLIYGIHHLFNVVTHSKDIPHAVLIRSLEPMKGIPEMLKRTGKKKPDNTLTRGPGNMAKALGIFTHQTGTLLNGKEMYIADDGFRYENSGIIASPRIGVDYAGADALLPYRFYVKGNPFVSGKNV
jgi:DNA-3-methyladenine glycosylase